MPAVGKSSENSATAVNVETAGADKGVDPDAGIRGFAQAFTPQPESSGAVDAGGGSILTPGNLEASLPNWSSEGMFCDCTG